MGLFNDVPKSKVRLLIWEEMCNIICSYLIKVSLGLVLEFRSGILFSTGWKDVVVIFNSSYLYTHMHNYTRREFLSNDDNHALCILSIELFKLIAWLPQVFLQHLWHSPRVLFLIILPSLLRIAILIKQQVEL